MIRRDVVCNRTQVPPAVKQQVGFFQIKNKGPRVKVILVILLPQENLSR